jgi:hypothetical protein
MDIEVVFLPIVLGTIESIIVIRTNFGDILYKLKGIGIENHYKIKPLLGIKLPVGVEYKKPIPLHNPLDHPLTITNVNSSEPFLKILMDNKNLEISPHQTKTPATLLFHANSSGKYGGLINLYTVEKGKLVIPIEILVSKSGVHSILDEIDFGILTTEGERKSREIILINSAQQPIKITEVLSAVHDPQLEIEFKGNIILKDGHLTSVAHIIYNGNKEGRYNGKILFITNDTNPLISKIEVPYKVIYI